MSIFPSNGPLATRAPFTPSAGGDDVVALAGHPRTTRVSWLLLGTLLVGALLAAFGERLLSQVSYAVERGRLQAAGDELASVDQVSNTFRMVAQRCRPGVVQIAVSGGQMGEQQADMLRQMLEQRFGRELTDDEWQRLLQQHSRRPLATGSGIILDNEGHILTNNHVISGGGDLRVRLHDGREYDAARIGRDEKSDLAVIKIDAPGLHPLKFGDSDAIEVGDWVLAIGAPFGLDQTVTHGIVSAKGRNDVSDIPIFYQDFLQTDAAINPGNSGGPLVDMRGEVVGVNTAIATRGESQNAGVAFTIPSNMARRIADQLKSGGRVERGWLGVRLSPIENEDVAILGLPGPRGVMVDALYEGAPAIAAGLEVEDVIIAVDGREVSNTRGLQVAIADVGPGRRATLRVLRDGVARELPITVGRQPEDIEAFSRDSEVVAARRAEGLALEVRSMRRELPESLAVALSNLTLAEAAARNEDKSGVLVVQYAGAEAEQYGVTPGDLITAVNGQAVRSVTQFNQALQQATARAVRMQVIGPEGRQRTIYIERPGDK